jgi:nicotinate-nucleotide adenylyltransferase
MQSRRAAIYGGTFDPVHNGHLKVARGVRKLFELDEVILIPACVPPHKRGAGITSAFHRFAMLALATEHDDNVSVSTVELDRPDHPYAVDTVARLREKMGSDYRLFFVMGADSWSEITTWREWQRLLTMCDHIVVTRPGYELPADAGRGKMIDVRGKEAGAVQSVINESESTQVFVTDAVFEDVSATTIRAAVKNGRLADLKTMVPPEVANYIEKYELYRN